MTDRQSPSISTILPYTAPFLLFAGLTIFLPILPVPRIWVYPLKTLLALALLAFVWPKVKSEIKPCLDMNAVMAGILAYILWIGLEGEYPLIGTPTGFDPQGVGNGGPLWMLLGIRLMGASLLVPVIEEIFWRSFALRFLINSTFTQVPLGTFSWFSFLSVSLAFGFEHHRWLPGILTGMLYALILYQRKNLFASILAHGITNLLLGIYVITNGYWQFW